eukprot:5732093-Pyramimonas_sp.AAC.1
MQHTAPGVGVGSEHHAPGKANTQTYAQQPTAAPCATWAGQNPARGAGQAKSGRALAETLRPPAETPPSQPPPWLVEQAGVYRAAELSYAPH